MPSTPLVTVVIPAYNHESYIQEAIYSVINQTYTEIELIIINDGSTDNTNKMIFELTEICKHTFSNFIHINRENKGLIKTLNEALDISNGKYFMMLGSDDFYVRDKISLQIEFFQSHPDFALCYGNITYVDADSNIKKVGKTKHFKSGFIFNDLLYKCFIPLPSIMIKTQVLKEFYFDERFFLEDYPLWLKVSKNYQIGYIKNELTYYRQHDHNVSSDMVKMIKEVERVLYDYKDLKEYNSAISKWYLRWFADLSKTNNVQLTEEYMKKALPTSFYRIKYLKAYFRLILKKSQSS